MNYSLSLIVLSFLVGCSLFNNDKKQLFEPYFLATINDEKYVASDFQEKLSRAILSTTNEDVILLSIIGTFRDNDQYYLLDRVTFLLEYQPGKSNYTTVLQQITNTNRLSGGKYYEREDDVLLSEFETIENDSGFITVELDTLDSGEVLIHGTFEYTVSVIWRNNNISKWVGVDTLSIIEGKYQLMLEDNSSN